MIPDVTLDWQLVYIEPIGDVFWLASECRPGTFVGSFGGLTERCVAARFQTKGDAKEFARLHGFVIASKPEPVTMTLDVTQPGRVGVKFSPVAARKLAELLGARIT